MTAILAFFVGIAGLPQSPDRTLTVFAAASLKESFTEIARRYEAAHPGVQVKLSFAGSQQLAAQIKAGADVDVFAAAATPQLKAAGRLASPIRDFAFNTLTIVVPADNPSTTMLSDIAKVERLVVADESVPAGAYTLQVLQRARLRFGSPWFALVEKRIVSREADVRSVLTKVILGEADAGFVYSSDAQAAGSKVRSIPIPADLNVLANYPVAIPASSRQPREGKDFIKFLYTAEVQKLLEDEGLISPLRPVRQVMVVGNTTSRAVVTAHLESAYDKTVKAKGESGVTQSYRGLSLVKFLAGLTGKEVRFVGADGYSAHVPLASIRRNGGVLVAMGDGNIQVVLPGQSPLTWVRWLRKIVVY